MTAQPSHDATNSPTRVGRDGRNAYRASEPVFVTAPDWPVVDQLAVAQAATETLSALDWQPSCVCPMHPCPSPAAWVVRIHKPSLCDSAESDVDGNVSETRCGGCVARLRRQVAAELARLRRFGVPRCEGCGAPLMNVGDVVREVTKL